MSTVMETWSAVGEVRVVEVMESLADLDRSIDIDLTVSFINPTQFSYSQDHHRYDPSSSLVDRRPNKEFGQRNSW